MDANKCGRAALGFCGLGLAFIVAGIGIGFAKPDIEVSLETISMISKIVAGMGGAYMGCGLISGGLAVYHRVSELKKEESEGQLIENQGGSLAGAWNQRLLDKVAGAFVTYGNNNL